MDGLNANQEVEIGAIFKANLDERDEVTPKGGIDYRPKYFIVIGDADYGYYVAYILINKSINTKYLCTKELLNSQFPLYVKDYPDILKIDPSYANLAKIREIEKERLLREATYQGKLVAKDLNLIIEALRNSEIITNKEKKRYGLVK